MLSPVIIRDYEPLSCQLILYYCKNIDYSRCKDSQDCPTFIRLQEKTALGERLHPPSDAVSTLLLVAA